MSDYYSGLLDDGIMNLRNYEWFGGDHMETDKSLLSEEDIKHRYITPALERVWPASDIRMELAITAGRVNIKGNMEARFMK